MNNCELPVLTVLKHLCIGFAVLVLISACLYWTIPSNAGLGLALMVGPFSLLIAVLGAIALGVALWNEWLPRQAGWVAAGTLVWALVPIIAGPIFAFSVIDGLEAYYASPRFAAWYAARSGIAIAPHGQSFHYADCSPDAYTATYTVTALHDKELAFVLLDRNGLHAADAGPDVAQSIGEQFALVREAPYYLVDGDGELGVFRVPAGTHTLAVKAQSAFQLGVMDLNPLWSPDLWLAGERRYYTLYADNHTWEEIVAASAQFRPASCAPPCTRLDVPPPIENRNNVRIEKSASIGEVVGETPVDADGDGYYDTLDLAVTLQVTTTGDYLLRGSLHTVDGRGLARTSYQSPYAEPLCSGVHTVTLRFDGKTLHDSGADGPYLLTDVELTYEEPGVNMPQPSDLALTYENLDLINEKLGLTPEELGLPQPTAGADDVYTTAPYTRWQFAGEPHAPTAAASHADDTTGNGLYDQLAVDVTFHGLPQGLYRWTGDLIGGGGCRAAEAEDSGQLNPETPADFLFLGGHIRSSGCDGPYTLTNVTVVTVAADGSTHRTERFDNLHITPAYRAEGFDTTTVAFGRCEHQQPSADNDDLYDHLQISATVEATDLPAGEQYDWRADLLGPDGTLIDSAAGAGQLASGAALRFTFSAAAIRHSDIDGPYTLGNVTITSRTTPTVTVTLPALCTTDTLKARFFEP